MIRFFVVLLIEATDQFLEDRSHSVVVKTRLLELSEKDKEQFESELGDVEFTGFYEPDHQSIADFLIDDMGRFRRFKGRDFNSFMPTLIDVHRRMLAIFKSMRRETDLGLGPSTSRVIELLKARINYAA